MSDKAREELAGVLAEHEYLYPDSFCGCGHAMRQPWREFSVHVADALLASPAMARLLAEVRAEAEARHRDLTRRLGFGDNITEPQADNDTIVAWFEQQGHDASEWVESQRWRDACHEKGHPDDEDCFECDPMFAYDRGKRDGAAEALREAADEIGEGDGISRFIGMDSLPEAVRAEKRAQKWLRDRADQIVGSSERGGDA